MLSVNWKGIALNTWPSGTRTALTQNDHELWNANNYPGTLEICCVCDETTGYCEEDNIEDDEGKPYCYSCALTKGIIEGEG